MSEIYVYDALATDTSTAGLVGALMPRSALFTEEAGGTSELTIEHPFDVWGKWRALAAGNLIKAWVPVRTTPEISGGALVTSVEVYTVKPEAQLTKAQRYLYTAQSGGSRAQLIPSGTQVAVVSKPTGASRWKIKCGYGTGWMESAAISYETRQTIPATTDGMEQVIPSWAIRPQLFVIQSVTESDESVTATALHISYQLLKNICQYINYGEQTLQQALDGILTHCHAPHDFQAYTDIGDTRTGVSWDMVNPIDAMLNPETGALARWDAQLIRDNRELFFLRRAGRDRGLRVEYARNLAGIRYTVDMSNLVTRVIPMGEDADGKPLYLEYATADTACVDSPRIGLYAHPHITVLKCDDAKVGGAVTVEIARARMRAQAEALMASGGDVPEITLELDYRAMGDTEEYAAFRQLDRCYLYDSVAVDYAPLALQTRLELTRLEWDCVAERPETMEFGTLRGASVSVATWQLPSGISGSKLIGGSVGAGQLGDGAVTAGHIRSGIIESRHIQAGSVNTEALQAGSVTADKIAAGAVAAESIEALEARLNSVTAQSITTDTLAAAFASFAQVIAGDIQAQRLQADQLAAVMADIVTLTAKTGEFDFATVQNLLSQAMILRQGYADSVLITNLAVTSANMLDATIGHLVLSGDDGQYYEVNVGSNGAISTRVVEVSAAEIAAGRLADGRQIVTETVNARSLNGQTVKASEAILNTILTSALTAGQITANEAMIASASIPMLYTTSLKALGDSLDISANQSINFLIGEFDSMRIGTRNYIRESRHLTLEGSYGLEAVTLESADAELDGGRALIVTVPFDTLSVPGADTAVPVEYEIVDGVLRISAKDADAAALQEYADACGIAFALDANQNLIATITAPASGGTAATAVVETTVYDGTTDKVLRLSGGVGSAWRMQALPFDNTKPAFFSVWAKADADMCVRIEAAGATALAPVGTEWTRVCVPIEAPNGRDITIAPLSAAGLCLYKAMLEAGATRVSDWTCAPEDTEAIEAGIRGVADGANLIAEQAKAIAELNADVAENVRRWMSFTQSGLIQGRAGSTYNTLIDDAGFHILQLGEKIGSFAKRRLLVEEARVGRVASTQNRCVLREAGDGGMIITVEGLT